ncbi:MAG: hypothetical protein OEN00_09235 [Gemmatimonadota bacterium]|nr:hypothetical protein [Gemmatimonadota bacterium]
MGLAVRRSLQRALTVLLVLSTSACMMWHPANVSEIAPEAVPERVRITRVDGTSVVLDYAAMRADSITGVDENGASTTVGVSDVATLDGWGFDPGFLFIPVIVVGLVLLNYFPLNDGPSGNIPEGS